MKILEFRSINRSHRFDLEGKFWSRIYEYPLVLDLLDKYNKHTDPFIHNTCWGWEGVHIWFKNILETKYSNITNSDLKRSTEPNTCVYNLKSDPKEEWIEAFDFVLNISTLEETGGNHIDIFNKSFSMVKPNGYFIATFDLPGLQLHKFEDFFNIKYKIEEDAINGSNSEAPQDKYKHLSCGYMVIQKQ